MSDKKRSESVQDQQTPKERSPRESSL